MYYNKSIVIDRPVGNNAFAYDERKELFGKAEITTPVLIDGTIDDIQLGDRIVFAENINGEMKEFLGLESLVCIPYVSLDSSATPQNDKNIYVMDNHNHALYCWYREYLA